MGKFYKEAKFDQIASEVVKLMPSLANFYKSKDNLSQYSERINNYEPSDIHLQRQKKFKQKLKEKIERIFNRQELENIQLDISDEKGIVGGVVDHHGILDHPLLLSVTLASNFYKLFLKKEKGDILTFATGNVPLNEPFRKRGIMLNGKKINIYSKADQHRIIYGIKKFDFDILSVSRRNKQFLSFTKEESDFLESVNDTIKAIDFSGCRYFEEQLTKINFYLWPLLFSQNLQNNLVNLIEVQNDDLIADCLIDLLQEEKDGFIHQILFNDDFQKEVLKNFEGSTGGWNEEKGLGTHFFWGLDDNSERIRLRLKDGWLVCEKNNYRIHFDPENIIDGLKQRRLLPGIMLKFSFFLFYLGVKPLMGYSLEYLSRLKEKMIKILEDDFKKEADLIAQIPFDNMNVISICKGRDDIGQLKDLHAFDIFFRKGFTAEYFRKLDSISFQDFMIPSLLFAYNYGLDKYGNGQSRKEFQVSEKELQQIFEKIF